MTDDQAERWVTVSALLVAGIYAYRRLTEQGTSPATLKGLAGQSKPPPALGAFMTAWGVTFLVVSVMATAAPGLGGAFAILIATADFLSNAPAVFSDVGQHTSPKAAKNTVGGAVAGAAQQTGKLS